MSLPPLTELLSYDQRASFDAIAEIARSRGEPAYLVGGAVRDWLLGAPSVSDLDITIEGDAGAFARALAVAHGGDVQTHDRFNTARWTIRGELIDLTMARTERYVRPAALPDVSPASISQDLGRRDFAINAIAYRLDDGALIDPHDGQGDLVRRSMRALHARSFVDDPTRILRGARYAARLGFEPNAETRDWMHAGLGHLRALSGERVKYDLELIFHDAAPALALELLVSWGVFGALAIPVPDAATLGARFDRARLVMTAPDFDPSTAGVEPADLLRLVGWGALVYNKGHLPVTRWLELLPLDNTLRDALVEQGILGSMTPEIFKAKASAQSSALGAFGLPALFIGHMFDGNVLKRRAFQCEVKDWRWVRPATTGDDLKARNVPPGPAYKTLLTRLRAAWLDGEVRSLAEERALLERLLTDHSE